MTIPAEKLADLDDDVFIQLISGIEDDGIQSGIRLLQGVNRIADEAERKRLIRGDSNELLAAD